MPAGKKGIANLKTVMKISFSKEPKSILLTIIGTELKKITPDARIWVAQPTLRELKNKI